MTSKHKQSKAAVKLRISRAEEAVAVASEAVTSWTSVAASAQSEAKTARAQLKSANIELTAAKGDLMKVERKYEVVVVDSDSEGEGGGDATGSSGHRPPVHHTVAASDAIGVAKGRVKTAELCVSVASRAVKSWSDMLATAQSHAEKARAQEAASEKELRRAKALLPPAVTVRSITGKSVSIDVLPSDTIGSVKSLVGKEEGIPLGQQHLMYGAVSLLDSRTFAFYNIRRDATLYLVPRSFGAITHIPDRPNGKGEGKENPSMQSENSKKRRAENLSSEDLKRVKGRCAAPDARCVHWGEMTVSVKNKLGRSIFVKAKIISGRASLLSNSA